MMTNTLHKGSLFSTARRQTISIQTRAIPSWLETCFLLCLVIENRTWLSFCRGTSAHRAPTNSAAKDDGCDLAAKAVAQNALLPRVSCPDQLPQLQVPLIGGICVVPAPCQNYALAQGQGEVTQNGTRRNLVA